MKKVISKSTYFFKDICQFAHNFCGIIMSRIISNLFPLLYCILELFVMTWIIVGIGTWSAHFEELHNREIWRFLPDKIFKIFQELWKCFDFSSRFQMWRETERKASQSQQNHHRFFHFLKISSRLTHEKCFNNNLFQN